MTIAATSHVTHANHCACQCICVKSVSECTKMYLFMVLKNCFMYNMLVYTICRSNYSEKDMMN